MHAHREIRSGIATLRMALVAAPLALASSVAGYAQEALPLVAIWVPVSQAAWQPQVDALLDGMGELGYAEGETVRYELRFADGDAELRDPLLKELLALKPAVLVAQGSRNMPAAAALTSTVPIVIASANEGAYREVVKDLDRPEGNVTGVASPSLGPDYDLALAMELVPGATKLGYLTRGDVPSVEADMQEVRDLADGLGVDVVLAEAATPNDVLAAYQSVVGEGVDVVIVSGGPQFAQRGEELVDAAREAGMPTLHRDDVVSVGGLVSSGNDFAGQWRAAAGSVAEVLAGTAPSEIPVIRNVPPLLRINAGTAEELSLEVPESMLSRAEVVE